MLALKKKKKAFYWLVLSWGQWKRSLEPICLYLLSKRKQSEIIKKTYKQREKSKFFIFFIVFRWVKHRKIKIFLLQEQLCRQLDLQQWVWWSVKSISFFLWHDLPNLFLGVWRTKLFRAHLIHACIYIQIAIWNHLDTKVIIFFNLMQRHWI